MYDEEDDPYSGFDNVDPVLDTKQLGNDRGFQEAVKTSYGRRPPTQARSAATAFRLSTGFNPPLSSMGAGGSADGLPRPMTSMRGTGYSSSQQNRGVFDPFNQSNKGPAPPLTLRADESPEEKLKSMERKVMSLIEDSCIAAGKGDLRMALERAKEASSKERSLIRHREQANLTDAHNLDLTFAVLFNLANQYAANEMYTEALNTYQVITKNKDKMFSSNSGRLRVNMANIYFKMGQYSKAIKFYRMALDQVPNTHKSMK